MVTPNKCRPAQFLGGETSDHAQNKVLQSILELDIAMRRTRNEMEEEKQRNDDEQDDDDEDEDEEEDFEEDEESSDASDDNSQNNKESERDAKTNSKRPQEDAIQQEEGDRRKKFIYTWISMQESVNVMFDSDKSTKYGAKLMPGIRQILDKKAGLFRQNMMGKRVNFAARSVISPDPYILSREIGVPERFAKELTYDEPVTQWNAEELKQMVENGPFKHPGANYLIGADGRKTNLSRLSETQRVALARTLTAETLGSSPVKGGAHTHSRGRGGGMKVVGRHLKDGDMVLMNRQPTLHKPSMMAHEVRVLKGHQYQTIRMHYANCKTYNADFDGDEMNMHFPQSELARAEAMLICNTDEQYVKPTDGTPLRGLIQDHVDAGVLMSSRNCFFERSEYQQLLFQACSVLLKPGDRLDICPPAIMRPKALWTGKQLMSELLRFVLKDQNPETFRMDSKPKLPAGIWGKGNRFENLVRIRCGELLTGALDKAAFGASRHGLVDNVNGLFGPKLAGVLLSLLGRLFTRYIQRHGFTCGLDDMLLNQNADQRRRDEIQQGTKDGIETSAEFAGVDKATAQEAAQPGPAGEAARGEISAALRKKLFGDAEANALDNTMKTTLNQTTTKVIKTTLPHGQSKPFPHNMLATMVLSGAKGSKVNHTQISCLLGQQELEGRRVPTMCSGRTLPSFAPYDPSPRAGGYITDRFLTGIRPQEYYFHCMAGREGLCDTAVKTSRSGYLQRCLVKHLEGLSVQYDYTVRDTEGTVVQFNYGGDSINTSKTAHLNRLEFLKDNFPSLLVKLNPTASLKGLDRISVKNYLKTSKKTTELNSIRDPVLSKFTPGRHLGAVSEKFRQKVEKYCETLPKKPTKKGEVSSKMFKSAMFLNYMRSLAPPGESVGVLAAQSVGEPSTQMTLNTFHLAGHGGANVTLGIPRLREIVMTASRSIQTPIMELPVKPATIGPTKYPEGVRKRAEALAARLSQVKLCDFLKNLTVQELISGPYTLYNLNMVFLGEESLEAQKARITEDDFKRGISEQFIPKLLKALKKDMKNDGASEQMAIELDKSTAAAKSNRRASSSAHAEAKQQKEKKTPKKLPLPGSEEYENAKRLAQEYDDPDDDEIAMIRRIVRNEMDDFVGGASSTDESDDAENSDYHDNAIHSKQHKDALHNAKERLGKVDVGLKDGGLIEEASYFRDDQGNLVARLAVKVRLFRRKILFMSIVERVSKQALIRFVPGIQNCTVLEKGGEMSKELVLQCEGINLMQSWVHGDLIDANAVSTNDIGRILDTYGVEAARCAIVDQITAVFGAYGISVDKRHLGLLADYMTHDGGYRPLNRIGMEGGTVSDFQKITFETSTTFLTKACVNGNVDRVTNPSSRIVMGAPVRAGTGLFDLFHKLSV